MKLIKNARLLLESGRFKEGMDILLDNKIIKTGRASEWEYAFKEAECEILDAHNCYVTPGFIDAHCHIGILSLIHI